ncbi:unnamed protein product [Cuscuta epithymum]|uniref:Uncharacterized protein n=1 Tax=Cuscuta epithymum TaxID=186058 RepID=A0AAV0CRK8_9ASTE|nr:unnamed protein product [Cuscuta epithymum]
MSRKSPFSFMNVRSLAGLLQQYYRVSRGGLTVPSNLPSARHNYYMNPGLRLFGNSTEDFTSNPKPEPLKNDSGKIVVNDTAASYSKFLTWTKWLIGSMLSVIFPFLKCKLDGIQKIEGEVEEVVQEVEEVAEVVEKVATTVEYVMGVVADKIPANSNLKEVVEVVEHASAEVAEDAHSVTAFIHKVEVVKEDLKNLEMTEPARLREKINKEFADDKLKTEVSITPSGLQ